MTTIYIRDLRIHIDAKKPPHKSEMAVLHRGRSLASMIDTSYVDKSEQAERPSPPCYILGILPSWVACQPAHAVKRSCHTDTDV